MTMILPSFFVDTGPNVCYKIPRPWKSVFSGMCWIVSE